MSATRNAPQRRVTYCRGVYILYICRGYKFVGYNPPRETHRVVETRRGTSLRRHVLSGYVLSGMFRWGWRRATARLYVGLRGCIYIIYM